MVYPSEPRPRTGREGGRRDDRCSAECGGALPGNSIHNDWGGGSRLLDNPTDDPTGRLGIFVTKNSQLCNEVIDVSSRDGGVSGRGVARPRRSSQGLEPVESGTVSGQKAVDRDRRAEHSHRLDDHAQLVIVARAVLPIVFERDIADTGCDEELWVEATQVHRFGPYMSGRFKDSTRMLTLVLVDDVAIVGLRSSPFRWR